MNIKLVSGLRINFVQLAVVGLVLCCRPFLCTISPYDVHSSSILAKALALHLLNHRLTLPLTHDQTNKWAWQEFSRLAINCLFIIERTSVKGAFGVVLKGEYNNAPCAVKVLHHTAMEMQANFAAGEQGMDEAIKAFERECRFLESFDHPNIVKHLSTNKHPQLANTILVLELMDCDLRSYLTGLGKESLTSHCQVSLSKDMASGLAYIHSRQVIHRDLCGDNILLILSQPVPVAKISDFGMSRLLDPSQMSTTLTAVGHRMGYLPPEAPRMEDEKYDCSLDVFSLGVIMVQIACRLETVKTAKDRSFYVGQIPEDTCAETLH